MKIFKLFFSGAVAFIICWPLITHATVQKTTGKMLQIGMGAKAVAMGEAQVAVTDDAYALYWNPAGLAQLNNPQVAYMHNVWIQDINNIYLTYAQPFYNGGLGFSINYLNYGEFKKIDRDSLGMPILTNEIISPYALVLNMGYGRKAWSTIEVGGTVKLFTESMGTTSDTTLALDLGAIYQDLLTGLDLGLTFQNIGLPIKGYQLPLAIKLGAAYQVPWFTATDNNILIVSDLNLPVPFDQPIYFNLGLEYTYLNLIALRVGYKISEINNLNQAAGLSTGFGIQYSQFELDYALSTYGDLGLAHRLSLMYTFAPLPKISTNKKTRKTKKKASTIKRQWLRSKINSDDEIVVSKLSGFKMRSNIQVSIDHKLNKQNKSQVDQVIFDIRTPKNKEIKNWILSIINAKDNLVKMYSGQGRVNQIKWDGKNQRKQLEKESIFCKYEMRVIFQDGTISDKNGVIVEKTEMIKTQKNQATLGTIYFNESSKELTPKAIQVLDQVSREIQKQPYIKLLIEGHSDGDDEKVQGFMLSKQRSDVVARYLTGSHGVPLKVIKVHAHGSKKPVSSNQTEKDRRLNRRVKITIIYRR